MEIRLEARAVAEFLRRRPASLSGFRSLLGAQAAQARALGYLESPAVSFAMFDTGAVQRGFAFTGGTLATVDLATSGECTWSLDGVEAGLRVEPVEMRAGIFVHAARLEGAPDIHEVEAGVDLAGFRTGPHVILFHNEPRMNRSAVSFAAEEGPSPLTVLVAGLAPGDWQLWRNGWLEASLGVRPSEGALCFDTRPGRFFLRHLD
jgi:hypothetical protein